MNQKNKLMKKIKKMGFPGNEVILTLEEFFENNNIEGSIVPNIYPAPPSIETFYKTLKEIKERDDVQDILIRICEIEDEDWPFTDAVYIITKLSLDEVKNLTKDLSPDEYYENWMYDKPVNAPEIKPEHKVISVWWD